MKEMHRLIVTSDTYKLASEVDPSRSAAELAGRPGRTPISGTSACSGWKPSRSGMRSSPRPGNLDLTVGGPSFDIGGGGRRGGRERPRPTAQPPRRLHDPRLLDQPRRHAELPPGVRRRRRPRPLPRADPDRHRAAGPVPDEQRRDRQGAPRSSPSGCKKESGGDLSAAVDLGYRVRLARPPSAAETGRRPGLPRRTTRPG